MSSPIVIDWSKVDNPDLVFQRYPSRRSVVYGTKGVVSSSQPLATEAGLEILRKGGNAADAAVATSAALNVTEPSCCGIGGDAFCLFYDAKTKEVKALNGSGRAPANLSIDYLLARGVKGRIPLTDLNSVTVPGAAAAWLDTIEKFGSGKVSVADVFAPAIRLAEEGVPVSEIHSLGELIKNASPNGDEMLLNGRAPRPGEVVQLPNLAATFKELVAHGKGGFYKGRVAQAIVDLIKSKGGVMELEDLANHTTSIVEPIKYTYGKDVTLYECPPNGQGITALLALGILENIQEQGLSRQLLEMEHNSPEYLHTLIEALRLAFADSQYYVTDPDVEHVPVEELLSKEYLATRARLFSAVGTSPVVHGNPVHSSDTVYFSVGDQWGNACSYIQSNYAGGVSELEPQGHVQVLLNILRGFSPQAALDAPRFCISAGTPDAEDKSTGSAGDVNSEVYFESEFPKETIDALRVMGHDARVVDGFNRGLMGRGQVIQKVKNDSGYLVWAAGSDPRADGHAASQI
ncbi:hypothetical protein NLJ89_g1863 [Agrocybe chaxingu]|uniref:Gamma-glutamyltranspeptidase n=1 Tax=Agrocybe chaxingu TaxID=84603 RepID=A0A9W8TEH5_9AGAR|nr:hypothetical protein NLJ89_g1863 [Agrocybe chaxingu]